MFSVWTVSSVRKVIGYNFIYKHALVQWKFWVAFVHNKENTAQIDT